jgi:hypothetical protein
MSNSNNKEESNYQIKWILSAMDLAANKALVEEFFQLYVHEDNFPDENEREPPEEIQARIANGSAEPHTHLLIYIRENINFKVGAGAIVEYYPRSSCVLLTYIFVHPDLRKERIATTIIRKDHERGFPGMVSKFEAIYGKKVNAAFFESNSPFETSSKTDSIDPAKRLLIFHKLGAKRLDLKYTQPPLYHDKKSVTNLYLCLFPALTESYFVLETNVIMLFLAEFYYSLRAFHRDFKKNPAFIEHDLELAERLATDTDHAIEPIFHITELKGMYAQLLSKEYLPGWVYLKELPRIEQPKLSFERASVCFEFVVDETYFENDGFDKDINPEYCVVTHSFETDLFAYSYQMDPPFFTRCFNTKDPAGTTKILLPATFEFVSEGRQEMFYTLSPNHDDTREIEMNVFLNFTYFKESNIRVWHLVLTSNEGNGISELDIIKLMKFFSGSQESKSAAEKTDIVKHIRFRPSKSIATDYNLYDFFEQASHVRYRLKEQYAGQIETEKAEDGSGRLVPGFNCLKTGIVQIDTNHCKFVGHEGPEQKEKFKEAVEELYANIGKTGKGEKAVGTEIESHYKGNKDAEYVFEAYCGIALGIFDYDRMGFEEVSDTLIPRSATTESFLTINRGVLTSFGYNDEVLDSSWRAIGISPYLLIPSAVLAANEYISIDADKTISKVLEDYDPDEPRHNKTLDLGALEKARREVRQLLDVDFLPNIFQYPTEQDLYNYGLFHRGILERNRRTEAKLKLLDNLIEECNNQLNQQYQFTISAAAILIAVVQVVQPLINFLFEDFWGNVTYQNGPRGVLVFIVMILVGIGFLIFTMWWRQRLGISDHKIIHRKKKGFKNN